MIPGKSFHTHIDIDATPKAIWTVLAETARYPEWNPYHVKVVGRLETGQSLEVLIHKPNGEKVEIAPQVFRIEPERELTWGGGIQGLFFGEHVFLIETIVF